MRKEDDLLSIISFCLLNNVTSSPKNGKYTNTPVCNMSSPLAKSGESRIPLVDWTCVCFGLINSAQFRSNICI